MTQTFNTRPELIGEEQLGDVLELGRATLVKEVIEPIEKGIDALKKTAAELQLLPGVDRVVTRIATLNCIFENMREVLGGNRHEDVLRESGEMVGVSFAEDFIGFLMANNKLPKNEAILLTLWAKIESNANWGQFAVKNDTSNNLIVTVRDSFLTRTLKTDEHRNCAFMKGYLLGFMWEAVKEYYYWFSQMVTKPAAPMLEPVNVIENATGNVCLFTIERKEKDSENALDMIEKAKEAYRNGNYTQSAAYLRSCIEFGFKEKAGLAVKNPISLSVVIKAFKRSDIPLRYTVADSTYAKTSEVVHGSRSLEKGECKEMIEKANHFIRVLDCLQIPNRKKKAIETELNLADKE